jgi:hypothetical protein
MKKWFNKQTITVFFLTAILFSTVTIHAETRTISAFFNNIKIMVDGQIIETDVEPCIVDGRTMVPVRFIAEAFGATVKYNETTDTVEVESISTPEPMQQGISQNPTEQALEITPTPEPVIPPVPDATQTPETTLEPTPAPTPDMTQYNLELNALTTRYNSDVLALERATKAENDALYKEWNDEYYNYKNSISAQIAYDIMVDNVKANTTKLNTDKASLQAAYDLEVSQLKSEYGI